MALPNGVTRLVWSNLAAQSAEQVALAAIPIVATYGARPAGALLGGLVGAQLGLGAAVAVAAAGVCGAGGGGGGGIAAGAVAGAAGIGLQSEAETIF